MTINKSAIYEISVRAYFYIDFTINSIGMCVTGKEIANLSIYRRISLYIKSIAI